MSLRPLLLPLAAFLGAILSPQSATAWAEAGHRAACLKAWHEMSEAARAGSGAILDVGDAEQFAATCSFADALTAQQPETAAWHFQFVPKDARDIDLARDCPAAASCLVAQIERQAGIVAGGGAKRERAEALKVLAHLVADLHQPLHVAFAEDKGGADIAITFLGKDTNLHALWDRELLEVRDPPTRDYTPFLRELTDRFNRERWAAGTPRDWAEETMWVMRAPPTGYVGNPGGLAFDEIYVRQNYLVARDQLDKAGVRLAMMLNEIFRETTSPAPK